MQLIFKAIPGNRALAYRSGAPDAYGFAPERSLSDGSGNPCRHCLKFIPKGAGMLILAYRPFSGLHAYTETGPIFLCEKACLRAEDGNEIPEILSSDSYILRGYNNDDRIVYGTGGPVATKDIPSRAAQIFSVRSVAYVHVRSLANNCFHLRIEQHFGDDQK